MIRLQQQLKTFHDVFFQGDEGNSKTMVLGLSIGAACILAIFGLYQI